MNFLSIRQVGNTFQADVNHGYFKTIFGSMRADTIPDVYSLSQIPAEILQNWSLLLDYWTYYPASAIEWSTKVRHWEL
jgi:hypothetical protein